MDEEIIEWRKPAPFALADITAALSASLPDSVSEAYVFGSYARGEAHAQSDLDLLLVSDTRAPWPRRALEFSVLTDPLEPVDLLVYTPAEWERMKASPTAFLREAAKEWIRIR